MPGQEQDAGAAAEPSLRQSTLSPVLFRPVTLWRDGFAFRRAEADGAGLGRAALRVIRGERKASREGWWGMRMPCPQSLLKEESR